MTTYIALLRGINVSGQKKMKMTELKSHLLDLDIQDIITYIQSGNLIFSTTNTREKIKEDIEKKILLSYDFPVNVFIITPEEIKQVISDNPFQEVTEDEYNRLHVVFLSAAPDKLGIEQLKSLKNDNEFFVVKGNIIYLYTPDGIGKSKLNNNTFEKKLLVRATARNFRTIQKLYSLTLKN